MSSNAKSTITVDRLPSIDALRGVAIVGVFTCHLLLVTPWGRDALSKPGLDGTLGLAKLMENGLFGVNLFFVLSGFVLFRPYASAVRVMEGKQNVLSFLSQRLKRLYPLFLLGVLIPIGMRYPFVEVTDLLGCLGTVLTGLFVFSPEYHVPKFNPPLWSLGSEAWFSLMFPLLVVARRRWSWKQVLPAALVTSLCARWWAPAPVSSWLPAVEADGSLWVGAKLFSALVIGRFDDFVLGAFLAEMHCIGVLKRFAKTRWFMLVIAVLAFLATVPWRHGYWESVSSSSPFLNTLVQVGVLALIVAFLEWPAGFVRWILWNPILQIAGIMCYSLYIWHVPLINVYLARIVSWDRFAMWLILTIAISATTAFFVERVLPPRRGFFPLKSWGLPD